MEQYMLIMFIHHQFNAIICSELNKYFYIPYADTKFHNANSRADSIIYRQVSL